MNQEPSATAPLGAVESWDARKTFQKLPNGTTIAYFEIRPDGPVPIVFIHGFTDSSRSWRPLVDEISEYRLLLPDLRGHGTSSIPDYGYSLAHYVDDIRLLVDSLALDRVSLVGHSLGGMIAQMLAATLPDRVDKLVLIGTTSDPRDASGPLDKAIDELVEPIDPDGDFMMQWYANPGSVDASFLSSLRNDAAKIPKKALKQSLVQTQLLTLEPILEQITAKTLILWGDADPFFSRAAQEKLRDGIHDSEFVEMPALGHNPFWEQPRKVAEIIRVFMHA